MTNRFVLAMLPLVLVAGVTVATTTDDAHSRGLCDRALSDASVAGSALAQGRGTIAINNNEIAVSKPERSGSCRYHNDGGEALLRHVTSRPGVGTALVEDRSGGDALVTIADEGVVELTQPGEVTHPAWSDDGRVAWALDLAQLKVWRPEVGPPLRVERPAGTAAIFSPAFTDDDELMAIVQEPVAGVPGEDGGLNNLWRYDLNSQRWEQLTDFDADREHWSVLRTPVVDEDGTVFFVRVQGASSATRPPSFELWRLDDDHAVKVTGLPREMYPAGFEGDALLWNVPSRSCGDWGVFAENGGELDNIACGAVTADPLNEIDPDLVGDEHAHSTGSGDSALEEPPADLAVVVGDFSSRRQAAMVASDLAGRDLAVVDHEEAPAAVRPGTWAVLDRLGPGQDPQQHLDRVRRDLSRGAGEAFLAPVTPGK